ncbi:MAG: phosphatase PAP2 family protein [Ferruginibacter sp.]
MNNFFLRQLKKLSREKLMLAFLFFICLWVLFTVVSMVFLDKNTSFDEHIFIWIRPYINSRNTSILKFISFFGSHYFLVPANIFLAAAFLFYKNHRKYSLKIVTISLTSTIVLFSLKEITKRERPLLPVIANVPGYSFPSGHSFSSLVFFGMLAYVIFRTIKNNLLKYTLIIGCFSFVLLIGFSRIYLKAHFASDVIAGFCLGTIWLVLARWLLIKTETPVDDGL